MKCRLCEEHCIKKGKQKSGKQKYYCKTCKKYSQQQYTYRACDSTTNSEIVELIKASCGIRDIARKLGISPTTVLKRILGIAQSIHRPPLLMGREYEMDEMMTFIGSKKSRVCIAYAIDRKSREVIGFSVGRRNKATLRRVVDSLLLSDPKQIRTDKCPLYPSLIPKEIHHVKRRGINRIERMNLTLRTHLKRLNRRTIAFSRSLSVLVAILTIYFWSRSHS